MLNNTEKKRNGIPQDLLKAINLNPGRNKINTNVYSIKILILNPYIRTSGGVVVGLTVQPV